MLELRSSCASEQGVDALPPESTSAGEEILEAGLFCDPDGEGAWG